MNERGTRPSVNRKTIDAYILQKFSENGSLAIIVFEYLYTINKIEEKLGISSKLTKPDDIKFS